MARDRVATLVNQRVTPVVVPKTVQSSCSILREAYSESAAKEDMLKMGLYFRVAAIQFAGGGDENK